MEILKKWTRANYVKFFNKLKTYQENGLDLKTSAPAAIERSLSAVDVIITASLPASLVDRLVRAYKLWVVDEARTQSWAAELDDLVTFAVRKVWTFADYVQLLQAIAKEVDKEGHVVGTQAYVPDRMIQDAMLTLPEIDRKNVNGQFCVDTREVFSCWYLNQKGQSWKALVLVHPTETLSEEDMKRYEHNLGDPRLVQRLEYLKRSDFEEVKLRHLTASQPQLTLVPAPAPPAAPVKASAPVQASTEKPVEQPAGPQTLRAEMGDQPVAEVISTALHYLERSLSKTMAEQFASLAAAIRAPHQVTVFPTVKPLTYKMPKTRHIPMTRLFLPTVRVEVPSRTLTEEQINAIVVKRVEQLLGEPSAGKSTAAPKQSPAPVAAPSEVPVTMRTGLDNIAAFDEKLKSFAALGAQMGKVAAPPPLTTKGRKLDIVITGLMPSNLPSVIRGLPTYVNVEAFWEMNSQARRRMKNVDYIFVLKHDGGNAVEFLKKEGLKNYSHMGEGGGSAARNGIMEIIDRRGWNDEQSVDKIGKQA